MPAFHLAFRAASSETITVIGDPPSGLTLARAEETLLRVELSSAALALTACASGEVWHCHRWADATVKPLALQPPPLSFYPGDTYIAVASAALNRAALARYIHLRDYFNAEKMAETVWAHLLEHSGAPLAAIVIEAR